MSLLLCGLKKSVKCLRRCRCCEVRGMLLSRIMWRVVTMSTLNVGFSLCVSLDRLYCHRLSSTTEPTPSRCTSWRQGQCSIGRRLAFRLPVWAVMSQRGRVGGTRTPRTRPRCQFDIVIHGALLSRLWDCASTESVWRPGRLPWHHSRSVSERLPSGWTTRRSCCSGGSTCTSCACVCCLLHSRFVHVVVCTICFAVCWCLTSLSTECG
jgi:hypothetical protein